MMDRRLIIASIPAVAVLCVAILLFSASNSPRVLLGGVEVRVEVARTEAEHNQGLSGRSGLAPDSGMLFVFEEAGEHPFWMKEMQFPLDIIWIGEDLKVKGVSKGLQPCSSDCPFYRPTVPVKYVLEVNSGFCDEKGIETGDSVEMMYI